jgi:hypothetical protein
MCNESFKVDEPVWLDREYGELWHKECWNRLLDVEQENSDLIEFDLKGTNPHLFEGYEVKTDG